MADKITLGLDNLTADQIVDVARRGAQVELVPEAMERLEKSRRAVERWVAEKRVIYGVTTGFGALCNETIPPDQVRQLQENIIMSHSAGVGAPLPAEVVRAMMAIRIQDLAQGYSGIRPQTVQALIDLLNSGISPIVPEQGSVGSSGDLCPMAHLALVLIGKGQAEYQGRTLPGAEVLQKAGLSPVVLEAGEGLALTNGTQAMAAIMALAVHDAARLAKTADIACAMSLEVLMGSNTEFDERIHRIRPHAGQITAARNMYRLTEASEIMSSHADCSRVQDAYTLRCSPQIHGASRDALNHVANTVGIELNSTTTNPLIFAEADQFLLGGNFHGQPLALTADYLAIALAEWANVSERRIERLVNPQLSGLPAFLVENCGLNSGFMIAQYTAAALVSENKSLAHPASVDSIPTSANKEDHVSMGTIAARKARSILTNTEHVLAIELLCAAQAIDLLTVGAPGQGTLPAYKTIRSAVPRLDSDRVLADDIQTVVQMVRSGEIMNAVEQAIGELS